jgi:thiamine biosynthesis lipoprotein
MGMPVTLDVRDEHVGPEALDGALGWLRFVDATFSTYRSGSEISRLNRGELALGDAHPLVAEVLARCEALRRDTGGYFDVRAPLGGLADPSGLVKGWAVARAAELLRGAGARNFCIDAGGDLALGGGPAPGMPWRVGIRHPRRRDRLAAVLAVTDAAVATSGAYERGPHIVVPATGRPPTGVLSVTIVGPEAGTADAYATAAFAMGVDGPAWTAGLPGHVAMTILDGDRVLATPGFASLCPGGSVEESLRTPGRRRRRHPSWPSGRMRLSSSP